MPELGYLETVLIDSEREQELAITCKMCDYEIALRVEYIPGEEWRDYFCSEECRDMYRELYEDTE